MAIWQFQCNIIPIRENIDRLSRDEMITWKNIPQPVIKIDFLESAKSWSTDITIYGNVDETCIEFFMIRMIWKRSGAEWIYGH